MTEETSQTSQLAAKQDKKRTHLDLESKVAIGAAIAVIVIWLLWAWIIAPFLQWTVQSLYEWQAHSGQQQVPPSNAASSTGLQSTTIVVTDRGQLHLEVPPQATPIEPSPGSVSASDHFARLGQTGDLYGGANALFASLALVAVGWAGALQRRTIREARETEARRQFETVFFELLKLSREIIQGFERSGKSKGDDRVERGYTALNALAAKFFKPKVPLGVGLEPKQLAQMIVTIYKTKVYSSYPSSLGPYFRLLYQTFDLVDKSPLNYDEQVRFANIARGQISEGAVLLLALNGLTWRGRKFIALIEKFGLLEHLHPAYDRRYKVALLCAYRATAFMGSSQRKAVTSSKDPDPGPLQFDREPGEEDFQVTRPMDDEPPEEDVPA